MQEHTQMNRYIFIALIAISCQTENKKKTADPEKKAIDTIAAIHMLEINFSQHPNVNTGLQLANLYAETKDPKAVELCNALLAKDTARELTDAVFIKGIYYANINDTVAAIRLFEECINRDWKFIEAYIEKGIIQYEQKNFAGAAKTFELAIKVANTSPDAYY